MLTRGRLTRRPLHHKPQNLFLQHVSIHSRPPGREKHGVREFRDARRVSIHSRPPGREKHRVQPVRGLPEVSIHSRPPGREKLPDLTALTTAEAVSIHSRPPGREKPDSLDADLIIELVSIHSRPPGREKLPRGGHLHAAFRFQSTPAHQDGRNPDDDPAAVVNRQFQSTPAHQDGRNQAALAAQAVRTVSIHSRPPGREKRQAQQESDSSYQFQSTPAHQDGRNRRGWFGPGRRSSGFNPLPPTRTGETGRWLDVVDHPEFQSTPAHQDGRNSRFPAARWSCPGFNPLPPTRTGETRAQRRRGQNPRFNPLPPTRTGETAWEYRLTPAGEVSIHSRPPGREKRLSSVLCGAVVRFQSTPAHQDGRNRLTRAVHADVSRFNPLPPTRTGETP